jgi:hypothetical protein
LLEPFDRNIDPRTVGRLAAIPRLIAIALGALVIVRLSAQESRTVQAWARRGAWIGFATYLVWQLAVFFVLPEGNADFAVFLRAGREVAAGLDPYAYAGETVFLNPLPALGAFRLAALIPPGMLGAAWTLATAVLAVGLIPVANEILAEGRRSDQEGTPAPLPGDVAALLGAALVNSNASIWGHRQGQLSAVTALALLLAVWARQRSRPALAGVALAVAAFKPGTLLAFLILFLRKRDRRAWVSMTVVLLGLSLAAAAPSRWMKLIQHNLHQIKAAAEPGKINDYGFQQEISSDIIAFDHLFYRLGLRDRALIAQLQLAAVAVLLAGCAAIGYRLPFGAAAALVATAAMLVLYHRVYDSVLLALPLAWSASIALGSAGRRKLLAVAIAALLLAVTDLPRMPLAALTRWSLERGFTGRIVQAAVLPYATWSLVAALVLLLCTRCTCRKSAGEEDQLAPYSLSLR